MKFKQSTFLNVTICFLLVVAGMMAQFKYNLVERLLAQPISNSRYPNFGQSIAQRTNPEDVDLKTFWEVWNILEQDYIEPEKINQEEMVNGAISGMTASLGDPYTMYLAPVDNQRSGEDLAGAFYGVGIELGYREGVLAVVAPLKGAPAEAAGVQAGDLILRVKDTSKNLDADSSKWSLTEAVNNIRGPKGTRVTLTLFREDNNNGQPFEVEVERGEIVVKSAEVAFVEHNGKRAAHITLSRFGERTEDEWNAAVNQILQQKNSINGVVLDMRNNPGGFFDGAIAIASDFIDDGVVVTQKGKTTSQDYEAIGEARLKGIPVEILVNRGSASASEIVAGALRDQLGAKLIGEKTFGKGTVQDRVEVSNGGGLHVTIARWLLPKGQWIHEEGIPVDIEVQNDPNTEQDEVLQKAIDEL